MRPLRAGLLWSFLLSNPALTAKPAQEPLLELNDTPKAWNLNYSSSAPHYFASVYGLLQQWSNTFFPNGHSIVPCSIPAYTKLYHGRVDADLPPSPEWVAFDIGMAYGIMGGSRNSHMLTYQTTRSTKCIYFDGESATLFGSGQVDAQMLHIYGNISGPANPKPGFLRDEYDRAEGLCAFLKDNGLGGNGWGFEGIVRMNAGFEMIWCDFNSSSIRLVQKHNVTTPFLPPKNNKQADEGKTVAPNGPGDFEREPFWPERAFWDWFLSGATHYGSSNNGPALGETRVKLTSCGFLSYYSPAFESQAIPRSMAEQEKFNLTSKGHWLGEGEEGNRTIALQALTRRRRYHDLEHTSTADAEIMREDSKRVLKSLLNNTDVCSGMDWVGLSNEIVQTYASGLFTFHKTLLLYDGIENGNRTALKNWVAELRGQMHTFLLPFLEYPIDTMDEVEWTRDSKTSQTLNVRCRLHHTQLLEGIKLTPEEYLLKWSVEEVSGAICSVLIEVGLAIEGLWLSSFNSAISKSKSNSYYIPTINKQAHHWSNCLEELMAYLGWAGEWTGCSQKCAWDEKCYIPMWPMIPFGGGRGGGRRGPPYGYPPYGNRPGYRHPPYGYGSPPGNWTGRPGNGRGIRGFLPAEADLWEPKCVKSDFFSSRS